MSPSYLVRLARFPGAFVLATTLVACTDRGVTALHARATRVTLSASRVDLRVGDSVDVAAHVLAADGAPVRGARVAFALEEPTLATIRTLGDGRARIVARSAGALVVDAASLGLSAHLPLTILVPRTPTPTPGFIDTTAVDTTRTDTTATDTTGTGKPSGTPNGTPNGTPGGTPGGTPNGTPTDSLVRSPVGIAELPRSVVDVSWPTQNGRTIRVSAGGNLQAALDAAQPGDVVMLDAGATFTGNFQLRPKTGSGWIVVTSNGTLPARGTRLSLADTAQLARVRSPNAAPAIATLPGASGWRLVGLDIAATATTTLNYGLVALGDGSTAAQTQLALIPSRLIVDRSYVHGHPLLNVRRCVALNSATSAVVDSYLGECHSNDGDSQAIYGWNGPGPFLIENDYLEAGHEIAGFGGPTPGVTGLVPSDVIVRHNHFARPMAWKGVWRVKNFWECKSCRRVLIEGNVMENNWVDAQNGFAILLQGLSDTNDAPWNQIADVTIRNNIIRNTPSGINLASRLAYNGGALPTNLGSRITIYNNAVVLNAALSGSGRAVQLLSDLQDVTVSQNSFVDAQDAKAAASIFFDQAAGTGPTARLTITRNVFGASAYPVVGSGAGTPLAAFAKFAPDALITANAFVGASPASWPAGNLFPSVLSAVVPDWAAGIFGGPSAGVDWTVLQAATSMVVRE